MCTMKTKKSALYEYLVIFLGSVLIPLGMNLFIVPLSLYNGGLIGIAQIIRTVIVDATGISTAFDFAGIINLILNIPLLILAWFNFGKSLFWKSIFSVLMQTLFFSVIPVQETLIISDYLTACIVGGVIVGFGTGLVLRAGGSGGGLDILGLYFTSRKKDFSVGKVTIIVNILIYTVCAVLFELPTAIYSIIYSMISSFAIDKVHFQAISTSVLIFTKKPDLYKVVLDRLGRGVTYWKAVGGYTGTDTYCIVSVLSKYDLLRLKPSLIEADPEVFIITNEKQHIYGNYKIRL